MPAMEIPKINAREESLIIFFLLWFVEFLFCRALEGTLSGAARSETRLREK
jgi:hypothetical protein